MIFLQKYGLRANWSLSAKYFSTLPERKPLDEKTIKAAAAAFREGCEKTLQEIKNEPGKLVYNHLDKSDPVIQQFLKRAQSQQAKADLTKPSH